MYILLTLPAVRHPYLAFLKCGFYIARDLNGEALREGTRTASEADNLSHQIQAVAVFKVRSTRIYQRSHSPPKNMLLINLFFLTALFFSIRPMSRLVHSLPASS